MDMRDLIAQQSGFEDWDELCQLVATIDISTPEKAAAFTAWKHEDGTKAGLLKLQGKA